MSVINYKWYLSTNTIVNWVAMMGVMYGARGTLLSTIRPCRMDAIPSLALYMYRSLHQIIIYLLKDK